MKTGRIGPTVLSVTYGAHFTFAPRLVAVFRCAPIFRAEFHHTGRSGTCSATETEAPPWSTPSVLEAFRRAVVQIDGEGGMLAPRGERKRGGEAGIRMR